MLPRVPTNRYFSISIIAISLLYLTFTLCFIPYWTIAVDEFVFARQIYEYTFAIPYRDFAPYKTVLGYYLLTPGFFLSHRLFLPLLIAKSEIALINAFFILLCGLWSARLFNRYAVLITLAGIISNHFFLLYSADLRVDMLGSWFCLVTILALLDNRIKLSGLLAGLAFLISQKIIWYVIAINGGMLICRLMLSQTTFSTRHIVKWNLFAAIPVLIYCIGWSLISSPSVVFQHVFYDAYVQSGIQWYAAIYFVCWQIVLHQGPALFLLWPFVLITLFDKPNNNTTSEQTLFIFCAASIALFEFISYKQPFPYNFVMVLPAFYLLLCIFFSWLLTNVDKKYNKSNKHFNTPFFRAAVISYAVFICVFVYFCRFSAVYYLTALLPVAWYYAVIKTNKSLLYASLFVFFIVGVYAPFHAALKTSFKLNGNYQKNMIALTDQLLGNTGQYLSGIPYLYQKDQTVIGMKNLIGPQTDYLFSQRPELTPLLLSSLYLTPANPVDTLRDFENKPVKVILNNYRLQTLPTPISQYIKRQYQHFYGSIYLYAPIIYPKDMSFYLKFTGEYRVITTPKNIVKIDKKRLSHNQMVELKSGDHVTSANLPYRLVLTPAVNPRTLNPNYQDDNYLCMVSPITGEFHCL